MFVVSFLTIMAIGGFPSFVEEMKVNFHYITKRVLINQFIDLI